MSQETPQATQWSAVLLKKIKIEKSEKLGYNLSDKKTVSYTEALRQVETTKSTLGNRF